MLHFVIVCNTVEFVAPLVKVICVLDDGLVKFSDLCDENLALGAVGVLEFAQLVHDLVCVLAHVLKDISLNLALLRHLVHAGLEVFVFVGELILQDLDLSLSRCDLEVDLLEDV